MSVGRYGPTAMISPLGRLLEDTAVNVYLTGTTTAADLYTDKDKTASVSNPVDTDHLGNLTFFVEPGTYDLVLTTGSPPVTITVDPYPTDVLQTWTLTATGVLAVQTGKQRMYVDEDVRILDIRASVGTAPTGSAVTVDVNLNGTTVYTNQSNRPSIGPSGFTSKTVPDLTSLTAGDYLTVDIDTIDSGAVAADLVVNIRVTPE